MRRRVLAAAVAVIARVAPALAPALVPALVLALVLAPPAAADPVQPAVVSANPVDFTPHVLDGTVWAIAVVGETVLVGGDFSEVSDATGGTFHRRDNIFAYELRTGRLLDLATRFDGPVYALAAGGDGTVYAGGAFRVVNGMPQRGLARISVSTGERVAGFAGSINYGDVRALAVAGPFVYAGGTFTRAGGAPRVALARLDRATGTADATDFRLAAPNLSRAKVEDLAVSPDGSRLVAIGAIEQAAGQYRAQVAMYEVGAAPRLADWYTDAYRGPCRAGFETYLRGVDFSPAGDYFVLVTTGRASAPDRTCDTAARFNVAGAGLHRPVWVNHTGGDSLYAVSATGSAVYVGGHQRWHDNPYGHESAGEGAVSRKGIAALDPVTGRALAWNPTRTRGVGVRALVATPAGLLVGSDTEQLGHEYHGRLGMFPPA